MRLSEMAWRISVKVHQIQGTADKNGKHMHRMLRRSKEASTSAAARFLNARCHMPARLCVQLFCCLNRFRLATLITTRSRLRAKQFAHVDISPYTMLYRDQADKA